MKIQSKNWAVLRICQSGDKELLPLYCNTSELLDAIDEANEKGQIKSVTGDNELIEIKSRSSNDREWMSGLHTITIVIDPHTKEHWEEIERRRI